MASPAKPCPTDMSERREGHRLSGGGALYVILTYPAVRVANVHFYYPKVQCLSVWILQFTCIIIIQCRGGGGAEFAGARITKGVSGVRPRSGGEVVGMMGGGVLDVFYTPMVTECWAVLGFCSGPVYFSLK